MRDYIFMYVEYMIVQNLEAHPMRTLRCQVLPPSTYVFQREPFALNVATTASESVPAWMT